MAFHKSVAIVLFSIGVAAAAVHGLASAEKPADAPDAAPTAAPAPPASPPADGALAAASPAAGSPAPDAAGSLVTLEIQAAGFDDDLGHAVGMLFRPGSNVLDKDEAVSRATSEIQARAAVLRFPTLEEGTYALVVFHDANDNGIVDHNFFHISAEQLGFSNGFRPGLLAGLPTFEKLQFRLRRPLGADQVVMKIVVK